MKKMILAGIMLTSVSFAASAQTTEVHAAPATKENATYVPPQEHNPTPAELKAAEKKADVTAKALQTKLGLSKEQYTAVYEAEYHFQAYCSKFSPGKVPGGTMSNITSERNNRLREALTAAQFEQYQIAIQTKQK